MFRNVSIPSALFCTILIMSVAALAQNNRLPPGPKINPKSFQFTPHITDKNIGNLNTNLLKKAFIARHLHVDLKSIGLSKPEVLYPGKGEFLRPGKASIGLTGYAQLDPRSNYLKLGTHTEVRLVITPKAFARASYYLVVITAYGETGNPAPGPTQLTAQVSWGPAGTVGKVPLENRPTIMNFVLEDKGGSRSSVILSADWEWSLKKIEIVPIFR